MQVTPGALNEQTLSKKSKPSNLEKHLQIGWNFKNEGQGYRRNECVYERFPYENSLFVFLLMPPHTCPKIRNDSPLIIISYLINQSYGGNVFSAVPQTTVRFTWTTKTAQPINIF